MRTDNSDNPLLGVLRELLCEPGDGYTEHGLIKILVARGLLPEDYNAAPQRLFQTHFLLFNGLYLLKAELAENSIGLDIGLVEVRVYAMDSSSGQGAALGGAREARLSEYYLNWEHFRAATDESVTELLDGFWRQLAKHQVSPGDRQEALDILGLCDSADYTQIKQQYRRLAMRAHPDRGGDTQQLQRINWAMSVLQAKR
ncbi:DNA-J related domain-containing protein [Gilvimarinus sp. DA14]|uniref:DNA-J related domain-containing protein n=1 Tax=Gilvimarinus sp. DA14 TaxID=2956798 RepID=UPI0020B86037|nr:DNA-J related domain-containing protein [Gilvimarinus sp. DA14]UTF61015.1 DnaJ domain-containing protein [Gilvimarinus sp. DA14]